MTNEKVAIVVLSDPTPGNEEALGRVFNALAAAYEFKNNGDDVTILFQGTGTRWLAHLELEDHPFHNLFEAVKDRVAGVSSGCAEAFGAADDARRLGFDLIADNPVPGTSGLPSLRSMMGSGYRVLTI